MAKLSEPVIAQISVMSSSGAKTLTKQACVSEIEVCQPFLDLELAVHPRSSPATGGVVVGVASIPNGHLGQILVNDRSVGASSEEISTASTEIVCVRPTNRNQKLNKRDLRIRSFSADRILEEDIQFTRVAIGIEDDFREKKNVGGGRNSSKRIIRQISDKSYLSWQDSETSCQDSLSIKQDSSSTRQGSPSTRQGSPFTRLGSPSTRQGSPFTRQGSPSTRQESLY
jgi:hypothetical protein